MKITIEVHTDNAAFEDNPQELRRVLSEAADQVVASIVQPGESNPLRDINGNRCGWVTVN